MKKGQLGQYMTTILLCLFLCIACLTQPALAYDGIDTDRQVSLTLTYGKDDAGFAKVEFQLYRVADVSYDLNYTLTGDFKRYPVSLENLDSTGWRNLAETLSAYVARDKLCPLQVEKTDGDGKLTFDKLNTGLYLVIGQRHKEGRYTYTPEPFLICLPNLNDQDIWDYDVTASPKYESSYKPSGNGGGNDRPETETVSRSVRKVWRDTGYETKRPDAVTVQLLQNGRVASTITLDESNNWTHTWNGLDGDSIWQVVEYDVASGYTVSVGRDGDLYIMTNTYELQGPPPAASSEIPPPEESEAPPIESKPEEKLPQTGMLWWPVPLFACGGMSLFLAGWLRNQKHGDSDEK